MDVKFELDSRKVPNGTVLVFGIRYERTDDEPGGDIRGRSNPTVYTYAMLKAGGFWYVTGSGKVPTAAGWGAIERWLERDGREVVWVRRVTNTAQLWPPVPGPTRLPPESRRCSCGLTEFAGPELHRPICTG
jgi:hypothetical protein